MRIRSAPLRVIIGALALLLMAISVFGSLTLVKNVSAKSECGVIILCLTPPSNLIPSPTSTAGPMPGLTPTAGPMPEPTPTPDQTSRPTPKLLPTVTASASPAAASTGSLHTPVPSPTSVPPLTGWYFKNQTLGQFGSNEFSQMLIIAVVIFLFLLISLGVGLFIFRRTLLPSINVKVPSSGTGVWSLTGVPRAFVKMQYPLTDRSNEENQTPLPDSIDVGDSNRTSPNRSSSHRACSDGFALGRRGGKRYPL